MEIPEEWSRDILGDLFDFKNGANTEAKNYGSGLKFVNVMDVFGNQSLTCEKILGSVNLPDSVNKIYMLKMGDVLFNRTSETFDEVALTTVYMDTKPAIFGGFVIRGRPTTNRLDPNYCIYCFSSEAVRKETIRRGQGVIRSNIGQVDLRRVPLLIPPLAEQKRIAEILSTWNRAIEVVEGLIENSQAQKNALMQQLLTGKKRLPGFDGEWESIRLKSVLCEERKRNRDNNVQKVLSVTNHSGFVLPEEQFSKRVASSDVTNYKIVKNGQYGYNPSRLNVGSFARLDKHKIGILSPMYVVFSVNEHILNSDYFYLWMSTHEANQRVLSNVQGSVRDSLGFGALCGFPFKLPPLDEQNAIAGLLSNSGREVEALTQQLSHLKSEKSALMQQLLTGKRRVKIDKEAAHA